MNSEPAVGPSHASAMLSQVVELIESRHRFMITAHVRPDGDSLGSSLALYWILIALGKDPVVIMRDRVPHAYRSLPGADRVVWLPFERDRSALADLVAAADLYVAPGPAETFGLAALEALASGIPVLTVASGGVPELVERSGAGATYPIADAAGLASAAIRLLGTDLLALGALGRAYAVREHAWPRVFDRIFDVYRAQRTS